MKLKYTLRGFGLGIIITACLMGAYSRNAVAKVRVNVLKQYGLGGEAANAEEGSSQEESEALQENADEVSTDMRDNDIEAEINSAVESAKTEESMSNSDIDVLQSNEATESTLQQRPENIDESQQESTPEASSENVIVVEPTDTTNTAQGQTIQITVVSGDDSGTVSRKLSNAGIIESASEFDAFLIQHGYDKSINPGTKTINTTDSWQQIAEKLTRK